MYLPPSAEKILRIPTKILILKEDSFEMFLTGSERMFMYSIDFLFKVLDICLFYTTHCVSVESHLQISDLIRSDIISVCLCFSKEKEEICWFVLPKKVLLLCILIFILIIHIFFCWKIFLEAKLLALLCFCYDIVYCKRLFWNVNISRIKLLQHIALQTFSSASQMLQNILL